MTAESFLEMSESPSGAQCPVQGYPAMGTERSQGLARLTRDWPLIVPWRERGPLCRGPRWSEWRQIVRCLGPRSRSPAILPRISTGRLLKRVVFSDT